MRLFLIVLVGIAMIRCSEDKYDLIIRNALVIDGTGKYAVVTSVAVRADTIAAIGELKNAKSTLEIDASGQALSPGFIDTHSHHDRGMFSNKDMMAVVSQGVTTIVVGQDGFSYFPIASFYDRLRETPVAVNVASYTGHNTLRDSVLQDDYKRISTGQEMERMKQFLSQEMESGSLGLSSGLEYDPGIYSDEAEVMQLAQVAAGFNGRYISHIRSEDRELWKAIDEIVNIGRETKMPVQISHAKLAMKGWWGQADKLILQLDEAKKSGVNISLDIYPYTYWQSTMKVLFPERDFTNLETARFALTELTTPEGVIISGFSPDTTYVGKTLAEVATLRKKSAPQTLIDLIAWVDKENGWESIIATSMSEKDIATLLKWQNANVCSDGSSGGLHPRGYGSFPKVIRKYVIDDHILPIEDAIHKMTGLAAKHMGFQKRGLIQVGYFADLVLFDPVLIRDEATTDQPHQLSTGINRVWVNGKEVFVQGKPSGVFPGVAIKREN